MKIQKSKTYKAHQRHNMALPNLRTNQRNVLRLVAQHYAKRPDEPCYLGRVTASRQNVFLKAVSTLESKGLISVDRGSNNFRAWTVRLLVSVEEVIQP